MGQTPIFKTGLQLKSGQTAEPVYFMAYDMGNFWSVKNKVRMGISKDDTSYTDIGGDNLIFILDT